MHFDLVLVPLNVRGKKHKKSMHTLSWRIHTSMKYFLMRTNSVPVFLCVQLHQLLTTKQI